MDPDETMVVVDEGKELSAADWEDAQAELDALLEESDLESDGEADGRSNNRRKRGRSGTPPVADDTLVEDSSSGSSKRRKVVLRLGVGSMPVSPNASSRRTASEASDEEFSDLLKVRAITSSTFSRADVRVDAPA